MTLLIFLIFVGYSKATWVPEMEDPNLFEGDIELDPDEKESFSKGNGYASIKGGRWPNARVPYEIDRTIDYQGIIAIKKAFDQYHKYTCLRFYPRRTESTYISFYSGSGCKSPVGYRKGRRNRISLGIGCLYMGTAMHEIGHSIGLYHEQSRPDRDQHIEILWDNIKKNHMQAFLKFSTMKIDSLGTPYDYESMMHYGTTAFGGGKKTIETIDPSKQNLIGQRKGFSKIDIEQINLMYCGGRQQK